MSANGATVLSLGINTASDLVPNLAAALAKYDVKLETVRLSSFQTYDLYPRKVRIVAPNSEAPFCIMHTDLKGRLLGNEPLRELESFTFSAFRLAVKAIPAILHSGAFDGIRVTYCYEDFAFVIDAAFLLERMQRFS